VHRGDCAGAVLALAGLKRAGLEQHATHAFEAEVCLPAPGQGSLALEGRKDDSRVATLLAAVHHEQTAIAVKCERAILAMLNAGCRAPVAILAEIVGDVMQCRALVIEPKGARHVQAEARRPAGKAGELAEQIVKELRDGGAAEIIAECRFEDGAGSA
jgi:hydroxymethylbilane synthase